MRNLAMAATTVLAVLASLAGGNTLQAQPTLPGGGGSYTNVPDTNTYAYTPAPYVPGLKVAVLPSGGTNFCLNLLEADPAGTYDIFAASNLVGAAWSDVLQGTNGQVNFILPFSFADMEFFRAARTDPPVTNAAGISVYFPNGHTTNSIVMAFVNGGPAAGLAVLVDSTNFAGAWWLPFTATPLVDITTNEGLHQVWFGFTGSDGTNCWQMATVTLDRTPPVISVTSPAAATTVSQPVIQLLGYMSEPVSALTFDVSNASGIFTNQTAYVGSELYDTNLQAWTTSYFQGYDVALANGLNTITLHATDLAGNTGTTNVSCTLDYYAGGGGSSNNIAPVLGVVWPADGTYICGTNFTFEGSVDDATATITAVIVDANGNTNTVAGNVDRDGTVWVKNVPLVAGANTLTVTARNAAGNTNGLSLTVYQSSVLVTMTPPTGDLTTVSGTVSDNTARVYVNEVAATVNSDGTWTAGGVPVSSSGTAVYDVVVYPAADVPPPRPPGGGGGNNNSVVTRALTGGNPSPMSANALPVDKAPNGFDKFTALTEPVVQVVSYHLQDGAHYGDPVPGSRYSNMSETLAWGNEVEWAEGAGGYWRKYGTTIVWYYTFFLPPQSNDTTTNLPADVDGADAIFPLAMEHGAVTGGTADAQTALKTGGVYVPGQTNLYLVKVLVDDGDPVPVAQVQMPGWTLVPDGTDTNWGDFLVTAPDQATVPMTPVVPSVNYYQFGFQVNQVDLQPAVDANRDGSITFDAQDQTSATNYYRFWVNDDQDDLDSGETVPVTSPDYLNNQIKTIRDLEDFTRLNLLVQNITNEIVDGTFQIGLKWKNTTGSPAIKLWQNLSPNGDTEYLTDTNVATQFLTLINPGSVSGTTTYLISSNYWQSIGINTTNSTAYLLFEGCAVGKGQLVVTINKPDGTELAEAGSVWLDIKDIKSMYQRVKVTPRDPGGIPAPYDSTSTFDETTASTETPGDGFAFSSPTDETKTALVFVHGSNIAYDNAVENGETMFKRLYWQGYKGRFVLFYWDTLVGPWEGTIPAPYNYNEYRAMKYRQALKNYVENTLPSGYAKNVIGHSMGNMVVASALYPRGTAPGMTCQNVIFMQAAVSASCLDSGAATLPALANLESPQTTPDDFASQWGYRGLAAANVNATLYNIYNANDYALGWWVNNQQWNKPENFGDYNHSLTLNYELGTKYTWDGTTQLGVLYYANGFLHRTVIDPQESMAFIARSRTAALGTMATGGSIGQNQNVGTGTTFSVPFGSSRDDHSGEFTRPIQQLNQFYNFVFKLVD